MVNLDPTIGAEIKKTRTVVVISSDAIGKLPIKLIVPITEWDEKYERHLWHIKVSPDKLNGLKKNSALDALQVRAISIERFIERVGILTSSLVVDVTSAIAAIIEYE